MRGVALSDLVEQLKSEIGQSTLTSAGIDDLPAIKNCLRGVQEDLYDEFDWPHLKVDRDITMVAGTRYYDFPADLNYERIIPEESKFKYNGQFIDVDFGIRLEDYNAFDSTLSPTPAKADPMLKWDIQDTGSGPQIEIWPVPATSDTIFRLVGYRKLADLIADDDVCDIDGRLIVLRAALPILADQESPRFKVTQAMAGKRLDIVRARARKSGIVTLRGDMQRRRDEPRRGQTVVVVR